MKRNKKNDFEIKYSILQELNLFRVTHWRSQEEYDEFNKTQKIVSDFDKEIKRLKEGNNE